MHLRWTGTSHSIKLWEKSEKRRERDRQTERKIGRKQGTDDRQLVGRTERDIKEGNR